MKKRVNPSSRSMNSVEYRWMRKPTTVMTRMKITLMASR